MHSSWQNVAERLAEAGWSWRHVTLTNRATRDLHVAEARNEEGHTHVAVADSEGPAFSALEESIKAVVQ